MSKKRTYNEKSEKNQKLENIIDNNFIISQIYIKKDNLNKDIRIINSIEECKIKDIWNANIKNFKYKSEKEQELKEKCKIKINNKIVPFNYFYKFKTQRKYKIKYIFTDNIIRADFMFSGCNLINNIDLSSFNAQNVTDMNSMFNECNSLTNINLSNFNIQNVTDMECMFFACSSLKKLNLSNFKTQNIIDKRYMFSGCNSLLKKYI